MEWQNLSCISESGMEVTLLILKQTRCFAFLLKMQVADEMRLFQFHLSIQQERYDSFQLNMRYILKLSDS